MTELALENEVSDVKVCGLPQRLLKTDSRDLLSSTISEDNFEVQISNWGITDETHKSSFANPNQGLPESSLKGECEAVTRFFV